jgi:serine/threonine-protein kinase RsbW
VLKHPESGDVGGRGLVIVQALSDRWGVQVTDSGKTVWCEFAPGPPVPAP